MFVYRRKSLFPIDWSRQVNVEDYQYSISGPRGYNGGPRHCSAGVNGELLQHKIINVNLRSVSRGSRRSTHEPRGVGIMQPALGAPLETLVIVVPGTIGQRQYQLVSLSVAQWIVNGLA